MDEQLTILIAYALTLIIGLIAGGLLLRIRSILRNLAELFIAIDDCLTDDCTPDELKKIVKEGQEIAEDGLGIITALKAIYEKGK